MRIRLLSVVLGSLFTGVVAFAQVGRGGAEWLTAYADAQRTSWIRTDAKISLATMSKPGFERQWTSKLDNQPRQLNGLAQGVTANGVPLFVPMSIVAGSSNNVYALDNDTGYVVWKRHFDAALPAPTIACAGGLTAAATRIVSAAPPAPGATAGARGGAGRGAQGYRSMVGEPGQGVPIETRGGGAGRAGAAPAPGAAGAGGRTAGPAGAPPIAPGAPAPAAPGQGARGRGNQGSAGIPGALNGGGPGGGFGRPSGVVYVVSSDGVLHVLGLQSGKDIQRPAQFLPANARWSDAIAVGTTMYTSTSGACGGAPNAVWAIDLESDAKPVVSWRTNGGSVVGPVAFTTDGMIIAAVGPGPTTGEGKSNAIVALDSKTLQLKDWFMSPSTEFVTSPMVIRHNERDVVVAGTKDGRVLFFDAASLGGANHATPLYASSPVVATGGSIAGALASWQEMAITPAPPLPADAPPGTPPAPPTVVLGARWILVPVTGRVAATPATNGTIASGGVVALKLSDGAALSLTPAWTSHDLTAPATPIVVNGVVFTLSTGRPASATGQGAPAVLHAYDGVTGKALWNSSKAMTSFASPGSFWSAMGQVYVGTHDGSLHAFGFLDERR
jgi:outer membrane protein assembly factor BamB